MTWKPIIMVALGGAAGSVVRFLTQKFFSSWHPFSFPAGTFVVNILGCLLIGFLYGIINRYSFLSPEIRLLLMTGFCGGFTTFSAFALEGYGLLQADRFVVFFAYFAGSVILGLTATFTGIWFTR